VGVTEARGGACGGSGHARSGRWGAIALGVWFVVASAALGVDHLDAVPSSPPAISLFGLELATATREAMRSALRTRGAPPPVVGRWCDRYEPVELLEGARMLAVCYTSHGRLARLEYGFGVSLRFEDLRGMLERRYGAPTDALGWHFGRAAIWRRGPVALRVEERQFHDLFLSYTVLEAYTGLRAEVQQAERDRERERDRRNTGRY